MLSLQNKAMNYSVKDIVWAKVKGSPWWPAQIAKLPDNKTSHVKVSFFGQETFALLDSQFLKDYAEYYQQYTKRKAKKLAYAIELADQSLKKRAQSQKKQKSKKAKKKKSEPSSEIQSNEEKQIVQNEVSLEKNQQIDMNEEQELSYSAIIQKENELGVNRSKIQKVQSEIQEIMIELKNNKNKQWKYDRYFEDFNIDFLNSEELLQSHITKMLKFILIKMQEYGISQQRIKKVQAISRQLKDRILKYLTNTHYYDQFLKILQKNKQNRSQIQAQVIKLIKKQCNNKVKKQFLSFFANLIGNQISNGSFNYEAFLSDLKDKKYELGQEITSKAGTQRFADKIIKVYK